METEQDEERTKRRRKIIRLLYGVGERGIPPYHSFQFKVSLLIALATCLVSVCFMSAGLNNYHAHHVPESIAFTLGGFLLFALRLQINRSLMSMVRMDGSTFEPLLILFGFGYHERDIERGWALGFGLMSALVGMIGAATTYWIFPKFFVSINPLWWIPIGLGAGYLAVSVFLMFSVFGKEISNALKNGIGPWRRIRELKIKLAEEKDSYQKFCVRVAQEREKDLGELLELENALFEARNQGIGVTRGIREELTAKLLARLTGDHPAYMYLKARAPKPQGAGGNVVVV